MANNEISKRVRELLAKQLNIDADKIGHESSLVTDLGADSLDIAEIALMIKEEFQYDLNEDEMKEIKTVGDVIKVLSAGLAKKGA